MDNLLQTIEEITGLDYDRFTRSVLLAQGGFASFLSAKAKERSELLEKITGTQIFSIISQKTYEKYKKSIIPHRQNHHKFIIQINLLYSIFLQYYPKILKLF